LTFLFFLQSRSPSSTSTSRRSQFPSEDYHEVGKPSHRSSRSSRHTQHRYHSEEKPSSNRLSSDEESDVEKTLLGGGGGEKDDIDLSQLPERVPTDDTSGYVESKEELLEDARDQRRTERCVFLSVLLTDCC
jgi:hypothetical protein